MNKIAFLIVTFFVITSCSLKDDDCYYEIYSPVTAVSGPETSTVNTNTQIQVTHVPQRACSEFLEFESTTNGNTTTSRVVNSGKDCVCELTVSPQISVYNFKATTPGTYNLEFNGISTNIITHTIVVE